MKKSFTKQTTAHHQVRKRRVVFSFWQEVKLIITMGNSKLTFSFVFFANQLLIVTFSHHRFQQTCDFSQIPNRVNSVYFLQNTHTKVRTTAKKFHNGLVCEILFNDTNNIRVTRDCFT